MSDIYDEAVAYLTERSGEIHEAWLNPHRYSGGSLFRPIHGPPYNSCGCLTLVASRFCDAPTEALTIAIRADKRIPSDLAFIAPATLPVFAEWNRRLDRELGRQVPTKI